MSVTHPDEVPLPVVDSITNTNKLAEMLVHRYVEQVTLRDRSKESIREFLYKTVHSTNPDMWKSGSPHDAMNAVLQLESEEIAYLDRDRDMCHSASSDSEEIVHLNTEPPVADTKKRIAAEQEPASAPPAKIQRIETPVYTGPMYLAVRYDGYTTEYYDEEELRRDAFGLLKCMGKEIAEEDAAAMSLDHVLKLARTRSDEYSRISPRCKAFQRVVKVQQIW